jgi:hypothetical protein
LQARGGVDRVPREQPLPRARGDPQAHEGLPGVDPYAQAERRPADGLERLGVLGDAESGAYGALRVILVGSRDAEDPDHRVPDELLHHPAVALDLSPGHREVGSEHLVHVFWVRRLRGGGEPIRSQNSEVTTLRSSATGRAEAPSGVAHSMQNDASAGFSVPQEGQMSTADAIPPAKADAPGRSRHQHVRQAHSRQPQPSTAGPSNKSGNVCTSLSQPGTVRAFDDRVGQVEHRRLCRVRVLEHLDERPLGGEDLEQAPHRPCGVGAERLADPEELGETVTDGGAIRLRRQSLAEGAATPDRKKR